MVRIESKMKSLEINSPSIPQQSDSTGSLSGLHEVQSSGAAAKLPKLELKRFNGRPTDWQAFIDCFDSAIHSNPKSLVEGPAASAIKGLPLTSANYKIARNILEQRYFVARNILEQGTFWSKHFGAKVFYLFYGNKQLIISAHMDNLLQLPVISSVTDIKGIRQLYDKTEITLEACKPWG